MTRRLYYENAYRQGFTTKVVSCSQGQFGYEIILEETAFYPEGGGQPGDEGYLNGVQVIDTIEAEEEIVHITKEPMEVGIAVQGKLNWERRFRYSQQHSGEHIFSGMVHKLFGLDNVGFHMGRDYVTVDFNGVLTEENIGQAEKSANEIVFQNKDILIQYPSEEELAVLDYRSKKELTGTIRIVTIPEADICACCGTHVAKTGEIGIVKVTSSENCRGGIRLTLQIGWQAFDDYSRKNNVVKETCARLSAKPENMAEAVEKLQNYTKELKFEVMQLKEQLLEEKVSKIEENQEKAILFETNLSTEEVRRLCDKVMHKAKLAIVFSGNDEDGYAYVIGSHTEDVITLGKRLNESFCGRGGGKDMMAQGRITAEKKQIQAFFQ